MNVFETFRRGAISIAHAKANRLAELGIAAEDYKLLTQGEPWNVTEQKLVRGVLAQVVNVSLTLAGLPARALPAQYVAAIIAELVDPINWLAAAHSAPDTFDAQGAANVEQEFQVVPVKTEQMISLVMLYGGGFRSEPQAQRIPNTTDKAS